MKSNKLLLRLFLGSLGSFCVLNSVYACGPYYYPAFLNDGTFDLSYSEDYEQVLDIIAKKLDKTSLYRLRHINVSNDVADYDDFLNATPYDYIFYDKKGNRQFKDDYEIGKKLLKKFQKQRKEYLTISDEELETIPKYYREFFLYANGVAEIKKDPKLIFPGVWKKLLELPQKERKYRTAWVYYMLGNLHMKNKQEQKAVEFYEKLRHLDYRFSDRLGVGYASLRSQGIYCKNLKNKLNALLTWYLCAKKQNAVSDVKQALQEINYVGLKLFNKLTEEDKIEVLKDSVARELIILAQSNRLGLSYQRYPVKTLKLLPKDAKLVCAGRLACLAYQDGKMQECQKYLQFLDEFAPNRLWLEARFLRKQQKYVAAAVKIKSFLKLYHRQRDIKGYFFPNFDIIDDAYGILGSSLIRAFLEPRNINLYSKKRNELAEAPFYDADKMVRKIAPEALYAFFRAEAYADLDYVADRLVSLKELEDFCNNHAYNIKNNLHKSLRNTLARRLMRCYQYDKALKYFDKKIKIEAEKYINLLRQANDVKRDKEKRAKDFYKLAKLIKGRSSRLFGTSHFPDYYGWREHTLASDLDCLRPTFFCFDRQLPKVPKDYQHHNLLAADYMNRAALLTKNLNLKIAALFAGGVIIKMKYPERADVFFKQLCDLRPNSISDEANKLNWFPKYSIEEVEKKLGLKLDK